MTHPHTQISRAAALALCLSACGPASSAGGYPAPGGGGNESAGGSSTGTGTGATGSSGATSTAADAGGPAPSTNTTAAATPAPTPPPAPARNFPPPPEYSTVENHLRASPQGSRCFQNGVIAAHLHDAYADGDFDGDGRPERFFQLPDCLAVITQGEVHWEFPVLHPRRPPRSADRVTVRAVERGGALVVEVRDVNDTTRAADVHRYRWNGTAVTEVP